VQFNKATCVYCNVCAKKCPTGALVVQRANKRWAIDRLRCISCGYCVDACPKDCITLSTDHARPTVTRDREYF
jgi:formate hydrogenlyase subunit 6/NADH:ubiquinone oxidoreductase subunit I